MSFLSSLCRVAVFLLSISFCASDNLRSRVNQDPLALLTHLHLRDVDDHRIPAFVITEVTHNDESISRSQSGEQTVPVVLATSVSERHIKSPLARSESIVQGSRNYEDLIARPLNSVSSGQETQTQYVPLRSSGRPTFDFVHRITGDQSEPHEVHMKVSPKHTRPEEETSTPQVTTTESPATTTATEAAPTESPVSGEVAREVIHSDPSYIRESHSTPEDAKIPLLIPVRKRAPLTTQYTIVTDGHGDKPSYVPSDVYTIETTTKYRPRTMHSNSIFYQKALSYLKAYKKELVQRRPLGATYRVNAHTDDPSHIVTAYGEIPPVMAASYEGESSPRGNLYQQQEMEPSSGPSSEESLTVTDRDREVIGYLPVIRLPRNKNAASSYASREQNQETVPYASASASSSSSSLSASTVDESSIMGKKPISSSAASYLSPSLRLRKQSSSRVVVRSNVHRRTNRMSEPLSSSSSSASSLFGYSPIASSLIEPTLPVLTVSVKRAP